MHPHGHPIAHAHAHTGTYIKTQIQINTRTHAQLHTNTNTPTHTLTHIHNKSFCYTLAHLLHASLAQHDQRITFQRGRRTCALHCGVHQAAEEGLQSHGHKTPPHKHQKHKASTQAPVDSPSPSHLACGSGGQLKRIGGSANTGGPDRDCCEIDACVSGSVVSACCRCGCIQDSSCVSSGAVAGRAYI
jgi:hypothetical protein